MTKTLNVLFAVLVVAFLAGGVLIVAMQFVGALIHNGGMVTWPYEWLAPSTFAVATAASLVAFVAGVGSGERGEED